MTRALILAAILFPAFIFGQTKNDPSPISYVRPNDSSGLIIIWKNLKLIPMNIPKMRALIDSAYMEGGEDFLGHPLHSIFDISEKDLRQIRRNTGKRKKWEVYIDMTNFKQTNSGYYIWLISKKPGSSQKDRR